MTAERYKNTDDNNEKINTVQGHKTQAQVTNFLMSVT